MADNEVQVGVQPESSPTARTGSPPPEDGGCGAPDLGSGHRDPVTEVRESLSLLADVALSPPCGGQVSCSSGCGPQSFHQQLQFLLGKADHLHDCLVSGQGHAEGEVLAAAVSALLYTCQPYFNHLESTARSNMSEYNHLSVDICSKLLDFSQQLCDRLEQLVLTYASYDLLSLDETQPNSASHFCVGQSRLGQLRLTTFRYCKPTPYLARVHTGLYKRMRWNVERLGGERQQGEEEQRGDGDERRGGAVRHTDYYFLCYEDIPSVHAEGDEDDRYTVERMWSIGQWVQVNPDPKDDIHDWITCEVPHADYRRLLLLGHDEPSSCRATDFLLQLL